MYIPEKVCWRADQPWGNCSVGFQTHGQGANVLWAGRVSSCCLRGAAPTWTGEPTCTQEPDRPARPSPGPAELPAARRARGHPPWPLVLGTRHPKQQRQEGDFSAFSPWTAAR